MHYGKANSNILALACYQAVLLGSLGIYLCICPDMLITKALKLPRNYKLIFNRNTHTTLVLTCYHCTSISDLVGMLCVCWRIYRPHWLQVETVLTYSKPEGQDCKFWLTSNLVWPEISAWHKNMAECWICKYTSCCDKFAYCNGTMLRNRMISMSAD